MKRGWKNFFVNAGIALASTIFFFILLEIALRAANPQFLQTGIRDLNGSDYSPIQYDSRLGWKYKQNKTWLASVGNESYLLEINSKGFNDEEASFEHSGKRFVFVGDSFTAGCCVNRSQAFYSVFQRETGFEAVSFGVEGYGTDQELLLLHETGFQYAPNVVVTAFFVGNDFDDNANRASKPFFTLNASQPDGLELHNVPVSTSFQSNLRKTLYQHSFDFRLFNQFYERNAFLKKLLLAVAYFNPSALSSNPENLPSEVRFYKKQYGQEEENQVALAKAILKKTFKEIRARGATPVLLVIPSKIQFDHEGSWTKIKEAFGLRDDDFNLRKPGELLCSFAESQDAFCLDLAAVLGDKVKSRNAYYTLDSHWNSFGHEIAGKALAEFVKNNSII